MVHLGGSHSPTSPGTVTTSLGYVLSVYPIYGANVKGDHPGSWSSTLQPGSTTSRQTGPLHYGDHPLLSTSESFTTLWLDSRLRTTTYRRTPIFVEDLVQNVTGASTLDRPSPGWLRNTVRHNRKLTYRTPVSFTESGVVSRPSHLCTQNDTVGTRSTKGEPVSPETQENPERPRTTSNTLHHLREPEQNRWKERGRG